MCFVHPLHLPGVRRVVEGCGEAGGLQSSFVFCSMSIRDLRRGQSFFEEEQERFETVIVGQEQAELGPYFETVIEQAEEEQGAPHASPGSLSLCA